MTHRIAAGIGALALGGVIFAAPAAIPAPATASDCYAYLSGLGYSGIYSSAGCVAGATGLPLAYDTRFELLFA
ncbi:hypothetical protein [Streptomyces sp. NPDC094049]|uniref:hypothetical protein n=1 Tax=Streptomyces sp. NPDC094049 TaxID=3154987 RepID=UPI003329B5AF